MLRSIFAAALWVAFGSVAVFAQDYPTRPIHLIVPLPAGGGTDAYARVLAKGLEKRLGQPIIIENRPGQGTSFGAASVARSEPDGYTLLMATSSALAINVSLYKELSYDPKKDFSPISLVAGVPFVLIVHPSLGVSSLAELVALAKRRPGELNYASAGVGSSHHLFAAKLRTISGIDIKHVPYRGGGPALTDVVAGHVPMMFADAGQAAPYVADGRVKALAVTVAQRLKTLPNVPTFSESGVSGYDESDWQCVVGPAGLPPSIIAKLHGAIADVVSSPETTSFLSARGMQALTSTPGELRDFISAEIPKWAKAVKDSDATLD